ncbi:MAG: tetratricopeptide repeat protein, partial [Methanomicrobia archaeon]|nr:tetratricopeptide repeat protein [Methanomicrobia archaeon]
NKGIKNISMNEAKDFRSTVRENWDLVYNNLKEEEKSVFEALDVIYECRVVPYRRFLSDLTKKICISKLKGIRKLKFFFTRKQIRKSIGALIRNHLIEERESLISCDDCYREGKGNVEKNIRNLMKILFKFSVDQRVMSYVGLSLMGLSDTLGEKKEFIEDNIKITKKVIELNPEDAIAHNNLGVLLQKLKRYDEAEKEHREAIRINPNYTIAHYNLGVLLQKLKRYDEAEKEHREAIRINPEDAIAHYNLGVLLDDLKRYDEAEKEYREAIKINPNYAEAHNNLGVLLDDLKRYDEVETEYREAIRINPEDAIAHNNLGVLLQKLKRYDEAEKEYRKAIKINPEDAEAHYNLGVLLDDLKRYDEAETEYREVIRINPNNAEAHGNLGILFLHTEKPKEAKKELKIAKELFENQGRKEDVKKAEEMLNSIE